MRMDFQVAVQKSIQGSNSHYHWCGSTCERSDQPFCFTREVGIKLGPIFFPFRCSSYFGIAGLRPLDDVSEFSLERGEHLCEARHIAPRRKLSNPMDMRPQKSIAKSTSGFCCFQPCNELFTSDVSDQGDVSIRGTVADYFG